MHSVGVEKVAPGVSASWVGRVMVVGFLGSEGERGRLWKFEAQRYGPSRICLDAFFNQIVTQTPRSFK